MPAAPWYPTSADHLADRRRTVRLAEGEPLPASDGQEIRLLSAPHYELHRLGFFFTPAPRHADLLLVTGPAIRVRCGRPQDVRGGAGAQGGRGNQGVRSRRRLP